MGLETVQIYRFRDESSLICAVGSLLSCSIERVGTNHHNKALPNRKAKGKGRYSPPLSITSLAYPHSRRSYSGGLVRASNDLTAPLFRL